MLGLISGVLMAGALIKEVCEPRLPANTHGNMKLMEDDMNKVRFGEMPLSEFKRNERNGKYQGSVLRSEEEREKEWDEWKKAHPWMNVR